MYFIYQEHNDTCDTDGQSEKTQMITLSTYNSFILLCNKLPQSFFKTTHIYYSQFESVRILGTV